MKYSSLYKHTGYINVFVLVLLITVFVEGIRYINLQNPQRGTFETFVTTSDVLCAIAFPLSTDLKMSSGSQESASSAPPFFQLGGAKLHRTWYFTHGPKMPFWRNSLSRVCIENRLEK